MQLYRNWFRYYFNFLLLFSPSYPTVELMYVYITRKLFWNKLCKCGNIRNYEFWYTGDRNLASSFVYILYLQNLFCCIHCITLPQEFLFLEFLYSHKSFFFFFACLFAVWFLLLLLLLFKFIDFISPCYSSIGTNPFLIYSSKCFELMIWKNSFSSKTKWKKDLYLSREVITLPIVIW